MGNDSGQERPRGQIPSLNGHGAEVGLGTVRCPAFAGTARYIVKVLSAGAEIRGKVQVLGKCQDWLR